MPQGGFQAHMDYRDSTSTHSTHVFFSLSASCSASAFDGSIDDEFYNPYEDRLFRGEARPTESIRIRQVSGRAPGDFVWTAMGPFIHNRIVELWKTNNISGWSTYPVEIYDRKDRPVPGYHGLSVLGRCQSIFLDKEHSALIFEENQHGKFPYYEGLSIDLSSWDRSDIFIAAHKRSGHIIVTKRVRDVLVKAKATNLRLEPISEVRAHALDQPEILKRVPN